jgi:hypothetical protein
MCNRGPFADDAGFLHVQPRARTEPNLAFDSLMKYSFDDASEHGEWLASLTARWPNWGFPRR